MPPLPLPYAMVKLPPFGTLLGSMEKNLKILHLSSTTYEASSRNKWKV
jgi:hypothetical protein